MESKIDRSFVSEHCIAKCTDMIEVSVIRYFIAKHVFDHLSLPDEPPVSISEVAEKTTEGQDVLQRCLNALVSIGLVDYDKRTGYRNTENSSLYRTGQKSADLFTVWYDEALMTFPFLRLWQAQHPKQHQPSGRTSHTHNPHTFRADREGSTSFDILSDDPLRLEIFHKGMAAIDVQHPFLIGNVFEQIERTASNDSSRTILVDVGGGNGSFLATLLEAYPGISPELTMIQDLPKTIALARGNRHLPSNVRCEPLDFFTSCPKAGARFYHVRACFHDYSDESCIIILQNIACAMANDSKLLIVENIQADHPQIGSFTPCLDLSLMNWGGHVRTKSEFLRILSAASLQLENVIYSDHPPWGMIEATLKVATPLSIEKPRIMLSIS